MINDCYFALKIDILTDPFINVINLFCVLFAFFYFL